MTCQGSVPEAILAFLEAADTEDAIRLAVSLGGDTDTHGSIAGAIAGAFWGVPPEMQETAHRALPLDLLEILTEFDRRFCSRPAGE